MREFSIDLPQSAALRCAELKSASAQRARVYRSFTPIAVRADYPITPLVAAAASRSASSSSLAESIEYIERQLHHFRRLVHALDLRLKGVCAEDQSQRAKRPLQLSNCTNAAVSSTVMLSRSASDDATLKTALNARVPQAARIIVCPSAVEDSVVHIQNLNLENAAHDVKRR